MPAVEGSSGLASQFDQQRAEIRRFLVARCGEVGEADDLVQEMWIKLANGAAADGGPIANPRAYLYRMANNMVLDRRRAHRRAMQRDRHWLGDSEPGFEHRPDSALPADDHMAMEQEAAILRAAIAELPAGARRALQLFRFEEHSQQKVAEIMGISRSGVEKHLALAMKHLRQSLANCGAFDPAALQYRQQQTCAGDQQEGEDR